MVERRDLLKTVVGTVGTGAFVAGAASSSDTVEIVTRRHGDGSFNTKQVPAGWWAHVQTAKRTRQELRERFDDEIEWTGVQAGERRIEGRLSRQATAWVKPENFDQMSLPDEIDGVPVVKKEYIEPTLHTAETTTACDLEDEDPVPGGAGLNCGTSTCKVYLDGPDHTGYCLMTNGHYFTDEEENNTGCNYKMTKEVTQGESQQTVGYNIEKYTESHRDFALVEESWDSDINGFRDAVKTGKDSLIDVSGFVTEEGMYDMIGQDHSQYGRTTCGGNGTVEEIFGNKKCDDQPEVDYIKSSVDTERGDSGSPFYSVWEDGGGCKWASIIAPNRGTLPSGESFGVAAYQLYNDYPIQFGPNFSGPCGGITNLMP